MALQNNQTLQFEYTNSILRQREDYRILFPSLESSLLQSVTLPNAYVRVDKVEGDKDEVAIEVGIYKDSSKNLLVKKEMYLFTPDLSASSDNFIQQAYEHLKALPDFSDSIDV